MEVEATIRLYIDPVLLASARIVKEIKLFAEKTISGKAATGPVDYIFYFKGKIVVCVTEAKCQKLKEGLAQNIAQIAVAREMHCSKRKLDDISEEEDTDDDASDQNEGNDMPILRNCHNVQELDFYFACEQRVESFRTSLSHERPTAVSRDIAGCWCTGDW